jgi:membrane protein YqaA with SNARE-associated domain
MARRRRKSIRKKIDIVYRYNKRSGFVSYFLKNALYVMLVIVAFLLIIFVVNYYFDIDYISEWIIAHFPNGMVLLLFFISETLFGLIPPDLFILWVKGFPEPFLMVGLLSILSYSGGLIAHLLGKSIRSIKPIQVRLENRFGDHVVKIKRWGSVFVVTAALLPLPYSTICLLAGMLNYPFTRLLYYGVFRIARFFLYAVVLYGLI